MEGPVPNDYTAEEDGGLDKRKQEQGTEEGITNGRPSRAEKDRRWKDSLRGRKFNDGFINDRILEGTADDGETNEGDTPENNEEDTMDTIVDHQTLSPSELYQLMSFHVEMNERRKAQFPKIDDGTTYFFDESSQLLVYVHQQELRVVSCRPSAPLPEGGPVTLAQKARAPPKEREEMLRMSFKTLDTSAILGAKVAPDNKYIAIQRSTTEIQFFSLDINHNVSWLQSCRRAPVSRILDFYWTVPDNLLMVTSTGVELYQLPLPDAPKPLFGQVKPKLLKEFKTPINWAVYSPLLRLLVASVGGRGGSALQVFYFKKDSPIKLQRFEIDLANEHDLLLPKDLFLAKLYGRIFCIHIHKAKRQMVFYQITLDAVTRKNVYPLHTTGRMFPHIVDNLVVLHDRDSKICMLYDLKDRGSTQFPIVGGLPMRPLKDKAVPMYSDSWRFLSPNYILDIKRGYMWEVEVDLSMVSVSFSKRDRLVEFLIRRLEGRPVLLPLIKTMVEEQDPLAGIAKAFDMINATTRHAIVPSGSRRSVDGLTSAKTPAGALPPARGGPSPARAALTPNRAVSDSQLSSPHRAPSSAAAASPYTPASSPSTNPRSPRSPDGMSTTTATDVSITTASTTTWTSLPADPAPALSSSPTSMLLHSNGPSPAASPSSSFVSLPAVFNGAAAGTVGNGNNGLGGDSLSKRRAEMGPALRTKDGYAVIDQADMYAHVFLPLDDDNRATNSKYFIAVVTEYIRSLGFYHIPIEDYIYKLLISRLVQDKRYYQLHQFLQYHIIDDSVHVACQLLSLEKQYSPAYQLALDMLKRLLSRSNMVADQIVEVLLTSGQFLPALRFIESHKEAHYSVRRILEAAFSSRDDTLFYSVYRFFEKRGEINAECAAYMQSYHLLFNARGGKHSYVSAPTSSFSAVASSLGFSPLENGHSATLK